MLDLDIDDLSEPGIKDSAAMNIWHKPGASSCLASESVCKR